MLVEVVRYAVELLADPMTGLAAQLAALPRTAGDTAPVVPTIRDETREAWVARGVLSHDALGDGPAVLVHIAADVDARPLDDVDVAVLVRYAASPGGAADPDLAQLAGRLTLRAARRALYAPHANSTGANGAAVTRNGVRIRPPNALTYAAPLPAPDSDLIDLALVATFTARDAWTDTV